MERIASIAKGKADEIAWAMIGLLGLVDVRNGADAPSAFAVGT